MKYIADTMYTQSAGKPETMTLPRDCGIEGRIAEAGFWMNRAFSAGCCPQAHMKAAPLALNESDELQLPAGERSRDKVVR
jgi:hypothetical protein